MSERKTISESKGIFHKEFPYVIPSIYRKVIDEYIVELNLLSNQQNFYEDCVFSYGLTRSFETYTAGYEPPSHIEKILQSICVSCDIDYSKVIESSKTLQDLINKYTLNEFLDYIKDQNKLKEDKVLYNLMKDKSYYSRLHTIGIYNMNLQNWNKNSEEKQYEELSKNTLTIAKAIGFPESRVSKDVIQYQNSIKRLKEARKLIEIILEENKRRENENS